MGEMAPEKIITELGGPAAVAVIANVHRTRPYAWIRCGVIPLKHIPALAAAAKKKRLPIKLEDFMPVAA
jgi:hypothetical protein